LIRKTGGAFIRTFGLKSSLFDINDMHDLISRRTDNIDQSVRHITEYMNNTNDIYGLEPVNPSRLQFSPLCIEALYSNATLNNTAYNNIKQELLSLKDEYVRRAGAIISMSYFDYLLLDRASPGINRIDATHLDPVNASNPVDIGNIYRGYYLDIASNLTPGVTERHASPNGVLFGPGAGIVPAIDGKSRLLIMPVITSKSSINTNAGSLTFTVDQYFGTPQKQTVTGGQAGNVTVIPTIPPIAWGEPTTPIQVLSYPQWGDRNATDDIDSFGTTALHIQVYEQWPVDQTIYFGPIFTPLHFNPSEPLYKQIIETNPSDGSQRLVTALDDKGKEILSRSSVDFRVPTRNGSALPLGTTVGFTPDGNLSDNSSDLDPISEWKWNTFRRAKLLSGGGLVYIKPVFVVTSIHNTPIVGGSGYTQNDLFEYPDGTTFKVNVTDGTITGIHSVDSNLGSNNIMKKDAAGILSLNNIQPTYKGSGGSGAVFAIKLLHLAGKIGYDRPPKKVVPITILTKPSNRGEAGPAEGISTTTVDLNSDAGKYDIFYYFHNDPTHYSLDESLVYYRDRAQYVISSVQPT
jgi:hypothetical protein